MPAALVSLRARRAHRAQDRRTTDLMCERGLSLLLVRCFMLEVSTLGELYRTSRALSSVCSGLWVGRSHLSLLRPQVFLFFHNSPWFSALYLVPEKGAALVRAAPFAPVGRRPRNSFARSPPLLPVMVATTEAALMAAPVVIVLLLAVFLWKRRPPLPPPLLLPRLPPPQRGEQRRRATCRLRARPRPRPSRPARRPRPKRSRSARSASSRA